MDDKVNYLVNSVASTDRRLDDLTAKVERWDRALSLVSVLEEEAGELQEEQEACVMELLSEVSQVKEDYEQLRTDIVQIQQLQRELSKCLQNQLGQIHARYGFLRKMLGPVLPTGLQMRRNCNQPSPMRSPNSKQRPLN